MRCKSHRVTEESCQTTVLSSHSETQISLKSLYNNLSTLIYQIRSKQALKWMLNMFVDIK